MYPFNLDNDRPHFCRRYVPPDDEDEEDGGGWKRTAKGNWSKNTPCCVAVVFRRQNGYYGFGLLFGADRAEWGSRLYSTVQDAMRAAEGRAEELEEAEDVAVGGKGGASRAEQATRRGRKPGNQTAES